LLPADQGTWAWRARFVWGLLGSSVVLLIQIEAVLIIADALGALGLRVDAAGRTAAIAFAVLLLVTAVQVATGLWRRNRDIHKKLLAARLSRETDLLSELRSIAISSAEPSPQTPAAAPAQAVPAQAAAPVQAAAPARMHGEPEVVKIITRFGLEPTWAYQTLDELGIPAARALSRQTQLLNARWSGDTAALAVGVASFAGAAVVFGTSAAHWLGAVVLVVIGLLAAARALAMYRSVIDFRVHERQYYPQLERLLELHRFELYRALAIEAPRDADEEKDGSLGEWRQGRGDVQYTLPEAPSDSGLQDQVQGLTDLFRGPELVGYEGNVSWEIRNDQVQLTFAKTPVTGAAGNTSLEVEGSGTGSYAPFDITANSEDVVLTQVRQAVQAPVDGRPARVSFGLTSRPDAGKRRGAPVVWFEIRQRGRFIQLLRVQVGVELAPPAPAGTVPAAGPAPAAGGPSATPAYPAD
jgi:hypothetical protein